MLCRRSSSAGTEPWRRSNETDRPRFHLPTSLPVYITCPQHDQPNTSPDACKQSLRSLPTEQVASRLFRCFPVRGSRNSANTYVFKCDSYRPCSLCLRADIDCVTTGRSAAVFRASAGTEAIPSRARATPQQQREATPNRRKRRRSGSRDDLSTTRNISSSLGTTSNAELNGDGQAVMIEEVSLNFSN